MSNFAVIRADLNSSEAVILSQHRTQAAAEKSADEYRGDVGVYVAHRKADGQFETRLEARDRWERV